MGNQASLLFRFTGLSLSTHTFSRSINNQPQKASHAYSNKLSLLRRIQPTAPSGPGRGDITSDALSPCEKRIVVRLDSESDTWDLGPGALSLSLVFRVL